MSVAPQIIHIENPRLIRNAKEALQLRRLKTLESFLAANSVSDLFYVKGCIAGLEEAIKTIEEMEKADGARKT